MANKFVIVKGRAYTGKIVIKASNSTVGVSLNPSDTGTFTLSSVGDDPCLLLDKIPMVISDASNGEFTINLTAEQTSNLPAAVEFGEDGFPLAFTCRVLLDIQTVAEGQIFGAIPRVYIEDTGTEVCLVTQ